MRIDEAKLVEIAPLLIGHVVWSLNSETRPCCSMHREGDGDSDVAVAVVLAFDVVDGFSDEDMYAQTAQRVI